MNEIINDFKKTKIINPIEEVRIKTNRLIRYLMKIHNAILIPINYVENIVSLVDEHKNVLAVNILNEWFDFTIYELKRALNEEL